MSSDRLALRVLWGKTDYRSAAPVGAYHPIAEHMLDSGLVAESLLADPRAGHLAALFARALGVDTTAVPSLVGRLVALHDIGKVSPSFQCKSAAHWQAILEADYPQPFAFEPSFDHGREAVSTLGDLLVGRPEFGQSIESAFSSPKIARAFAVALGSHHGTMIGESHLRPEVPIRLRPGVFDQKWMSDWRSARQRVVDLIWRSIGDEGLRPMLSPDNLSAAIALLNGMSILADWIASDSDAFPLVAPEFDTYRATSASLAAAAAGNRDLFRFLPAMASDPAFSTVSDRSPRPLQAALAPSSLARMPRQMLCIIEAQTGEGKTEAALLAALRLAHAGGCNGFYFALPTVATSNQMFIRVRGILASLANTAPAALMLVNSQAEFQEDFGAAIERARAGGDQSDTRIVADTWLLPHKKALLSPYAVGTIDQAMIAALNVKHSMLRLFGLAGKVVIIDEIHAYDFYSSTIIVRLVEWLRTVGASVIMLSATLPRTRRDELTRAFGADQRCADDPSSGASRDPYPMITIVDGQDLSPPTITLIPEPGQASRRFTLERRADGDDALADNAAYLLNQVRAGGSACWLCNTVVEAQRAFHALRAATGATDAEHSPDLMLYHARFPLWRRKEIESEVLSRLGPTGDRSRPLIVVASSVMEQSVDADFDLLMTQLAPIDLMIQRMGRLHRHAWHQPNRPAPLATPRVVLLEPAIVRRQPRFGRYSRIYEHFVLLKTIVALHGRTAINVPDDVRELIESVYDETMPSEAILAQSLLSPECFGEALQRLDSMRAQHKEWAKSRMLKQPDREGQFYLHPVSPIDDDRAGEDEGVAAITRLTLPSVRLVFAECGSRLDVALRGPRGSLTVEQTREALANSVSITHWQLVNWVKRAQDSRVVSLQQHRGLGGYYLMTVTDQRFEWQDDARNHSLVISNELGVLIDWRNDESSVEDN